jgi:hypothetical protein
MPEKFRQFISSYWILILLIIIKMILQYVVINPVYELHRDEYLYLNQADHLAFGYISVPPLTALISRIIYFLGGSIFWVHFFPALFGAMTIVFTWLIVESMGGNLFAKIVAACGMLFSLLIRINILYQPNSFDMLAWTIIFYLLIKFIQTKENKWLFILAIIVAAGFYNKYTMIFLIAGLAAGLILTDQRKIFLNRYFWMAIAVSLLLLSPNIIWQVRNHFSVFEHMKVLKHNQLDNNSAAGFLKSQIAFFVGSLALTVGAIFAFFSFKRFTSYRFIVICFASVMIIFALMKAKDYYAIGLFPVMIAFGSVFFDSILKNFWRPMVLTLLIAINLIVFLMLFKLVLPVLNPDEIRKNAETFTKLGLLRWEDGKNHNLPQDFADMIGWKEMAEKSKEAYKMLAPEDQKNTLVICDNYGQAGALNYYNRKQMPEAYSFNTDYIYWMPVLNRIQNILLVGDKPSDEVISMFKECKLTGVVENPEAREKNTGIYLLTGANDSFTAIFYNLVEERKAKLDIF